MIWTSYELIIKEYTQGMVLLNIISHYLSEPNATHLSKDQRHSRLSAEILGLSVSSTLPRGLHTGGGCAINTCCGCGRDPDEIDKDVGLDGMGEYGGGGVSLVAVEVFP